MRDRRCMIRIQKTNSLILYPFKVLFQNSFSVPKHPVIFSSWICWATAVSAVACKAVATLFWMPLLSLNSYLLSFYLSSEYMLIVSEFILALGSVLVQTSDKCTDGWINQCMHVCWVTSVVSDSLHPKDFSPPGSSVHRILQARILEWIAMLCCRGSSRSRVLTFVSCGSWIAGRFFTAESPGKPQINE